MIRVIIYPNLLISQKEKKPMFKEYFEECIRYSQQDYLSFKSGDDLPKKFLGLEYIYLQKTLHNDVLNYYFQHHEKLEQLRKQGNLSSYHFCRYIKIFCKHNSPLDTIVFNKKVNLSAEVCKQKIINTLQYDFDSFSIKLGNVRLTVTKNMVGQYSVYQYIGKNENIDHSSMQGFRLLHTFDIQNLNLQPVKY